jgi:hypothetical protein
MIFIYILIALLIYIWSTIATITFMLGGICIILAKSVNMEYKHSWIKLGLASFFWPITIILIVTKKNKIG